MGNGTMKAYDLSKIIYITYTILQIKKESLIAPFTKVMI